MIGTVVGNYKVLDLIGAGGMGAVYRGIDLMIEREVAIKVLRSELARQPEIVERFRIEAVALAKLSHPNIATLFSFFRQVDDYFMVMEFVRGQTLDDHLRTLGRMEQVIAVPLFCQALEGIDHAHRMGIIHRDIKGSNLMLTEAGSVKVMDFGIARVLGSARMTRQGSIVGTLEYISPEQLMGLEADSRSDIYSLGILLYEMLTGMVPFSNDNEYQLMKAQMEITPPSPRVISPSVSPPVEFAIMKALAKRPGDRFGTAAEFRQTLLAALRPVQPISAPLPYPYMGQGSTADVPRASPGGLAPGPQSQPAPATRVPEPGQAWRGLYGRPVKETAVPGQPNPDPAALWQQMVPQRPPKNPSIFGRMNWKHYTMLAALLVVFLSAPFAVVLLGRQMLSNNTSQAPGQQAGQEVGQEAPQALPSPSVQINPSAPAQNATPQAGAASSVSPGNTGSLIEPQSTVDPGKNLRVAQSDALRKKTETAARDRAKKHAEAERDLDK
ncbi:MAG TPA: protein kinase [Blastocatellia bacterium]